jgi:hypothetical protein
MKRLVLFLVAVLVTSAVGCAPYDQPEFVEIQHHETGYLIPLEGENKDGQAQFDSEDFLDESKVAIKRIQIPHRWVKTGRLWFTGHYIDTVRLVLVDRSPVTRQWTAETHSGTEHQDQAVWLESKDSIGFSLGFNCTAFVDEPDSSKFLYMYPTTIADDSETNVDKSIASLATVMDTEIRARVQQVAAEVAAQYDLDELRGKKQDIIDKVRADVIPFFKERGITITTLGMFGGFSYEQPKIQVAIDETFIAQQEKVKSAAAFEAQQKKNEKIELEANALAERARRVAQGQADAEITLANAEAEAIRKVAAATKEAGKDPLFIQLKQLEVETSRIEKWDGKYPTSLMNMGSGDTPNLLLNVPASPVK